MCFFLVVWGPVNDEAIEQSNVFDVQLFEAQKMACGAVSRRHGDPCAGVSGLGVPWLSWKFHVISVFFFSSRSKFIHVFILKFLKCYQKFLKCYQDTWQDTWQDPSCVSKFARRGIFEAMVISVTMAQRPPRRPGWLRRDPVPMERNAQLSLPSWKHEAGHGGPSDENFQRTGQPSWLQKWGYTQKSMRFNGHPTEK